MTAGETHHDAIVLFSGGAGAWELGCEWAGVRVVASCESDPVRREMLRANFGDVHPIYDDVRTVTADRIRADLALPRTWRPWAVFGSAPCQDASDANLAGRGLDGERTGLLRHHVRLVRDLRSDWFGAENVSGLKVAECQRILEWLGAAYRGWIHRVGDEDVGAPQRAWRRFILARRIAASAEEPLRLGEQPRDAASDQSAEADEGAFRAEVERWGASAAAADAASNPQGQHDGAGDDRSLARCAPLVGSRRRVARGAWRNHSSAALRRHLRMAARLPAGLAKQAQEALGDAFPPQLAQAWIEAMKAADAA